MIGYWHDKKGVWYACELTKCELCGANAHFEGSKHMTDKRAMEKLDAKRIKNMPREVYPNQPIVGKINGWFCSSCLDKIHNDDVRGVDEKKV